MPRLWSNFRISLVLRRMAKTLEAITYYSLEFYPIMAALLVWGHLWKNNSILFLTDNKALVYIINKQSSKDKSIMFLVKILVLQCLKLNIHLKVKYIPGKHNILPDLISPFQVHRAGLIGSMFGPHPREISPNTLQIP